MRGIADAKQALAIPLAQHIDRRTDVLDLETGALAHDGMPTVAADHQRGADFEIAAGRLGAQPDDAAALLDQVGGLRLHMQVEARIALAVLGEEIEEVPL